MRKRFLKIDGWFWPLMPPWRYTPWGWVAAVVWNVCELLHVSPPAAHWLFGLIVGRSPREVRYDERGNRIGDE